MRDHLVTGRRGAVMAAALVGFAAIGANVLPSTAQEPPPPIAAEPLTGRAVFTDDVDLKIKIKTPHGRTVVRAKDPSRTAVVRFTVQPGAEFPWHTHPGPVIVNVVEGALTYVDSDGCARTTYPAGTAFVDPGHGHVHSAVNPTSGPTVLMATFFEAPAGTASLLIPADAPPGCSVKRKRS